MFYRRLWMCVRLSRDPPERSASALCSFPHGFLSQTHFLSALCDAIYRTGNDISSSPITHSAFSPSDVGSCALTSV